MKTASIDDDPNIREMQNILGRNIKGISDKKFYP